MIGSSSFGRRMEGRKAQPAPTGTRKDPIRSLHAATAWIGQESRPAALPIRRYMRLAQEDCASAGQEADSYPPDVVVGIRVEQADRLPRTQGEPPADHRYGQRWRHEQGEHVIRAVPWRAVAMAVATFLARQQPVERLEQVIV